MERIAAYNENGVTRYVYDGRGSVAQAISAPVAGEAVTSALTDVSVQTFFLYRLCEQMGGVKVSGFTYNAEAYDAATGMLNLCARQYEPAMNRFSQKDIIRGQAVSPLSLNRYMYCVNSPVMHTDPSGESVLDSIGNWWRKAKQTTVGKIIDTLIVKPVTSVVKTIAKVAKPVVDVVSDAVKKPARPIRLHSKRLLLLIQAVQHMKLKYSLFGKRACSKHIGDEDAANEITQQLERIQNYDKADWLFLAGDCLLDESISLSE